MSPRPRSSSRRDQREDLAEELRASRERTFWRQQHWRLLGTCPWISTTGLSRVTFEWKPWRQLDNVSYNTIFNCLHGVWSSGGKSGDAQYVAEAELCVAQWRWWGIRPENMPLAPSLSMASLSLYCAVFAALFQLCSTDAISFAWVGPLRGLPDMMSPSDGEGVMEKQR